MVTRTLKCAGLVASALALAGQAISVDYDIELLPTAQFEHGGASFIADDGTVLAYNWNYIGIPALYHGYIYNDGSIVNLQRLPQHASASASSMNSAGMIVGACQRGYEGPYSSAVWDRNGNVSAPFLFTRIGYASSISDINENGQIAMNVHGWSPQYRAVFLENGLPTFLFASGPLNIATEINNNGVVVGYRSGSSYQAFAWDRGVVTFLPGLDSRAGGISNGGVIVGSSEDRPVYWENGVMHELPMGGYPFGYASAINDNRIIIGGLYLQGGERVGAVWEKGKLTILDSIVSPELGMREMSPASINSSGRICGSGRLRSGRSRGFILTPR